RRKGGAAAFCTLRLRRPTATGEGRSLLGRLGGRRDAAEPRSPRRHRRHRGCRPQRRRAAEVANSRGVDGICRFAALAASRRRRDGVQALAAGLLLLPVLLPASPWLKIGYF
ncbi:Os08g0172300, partial [Oryza sativa Japonica Group]